MSDYMAPFAILCLAVTAIVQAYTIDKLAERIDHVEQQLGSSRDEALTVHAAVSVAPRAADPTIYPTWTVGSATPTLSFPPVGGPVAVCEATGLEGHTRERGTARRPLHRQQTCTEHGGDVASAQPGQSEPSERSATGGAALTPTRHTTRGHQ